MEDETLPPVWDFDEDFEPPEIRWENEAGKPEKFETLLVVEGEIALQFAERCIVNGLTPTNRIPEIGLKMYERKADSSVVVTRLRGDDSLAADATELLAPWIEAAENVYALNTVPLAYYKTLSEIGDDTVTRALHTEYSKNKISEIPPLESPNILSGVSAGVINHRDHRNLSASIYVFYVRMGAYGLDSWTAKPIYRLLRKLNIPHVEEFSQKYESSKLSSNLYT